MTTTPVKVPDELFEALRAQLNERQLVELTISLASVTPAFLPTAEPISIQNGHPISVAVLMLARAFTTGSAELIFSSANSIPPSAASNFG
jgi:hypothetical protein